MKKFSVWKYSTLHPFQNSALDGCKWSPLDRLFSNSPHPPPAPPGSSTCSNKLSGPFSSRTNPDTVKKTYLAPLYKVQADPRSFILYIGELF
jgi:hypothetical protein